jgi:hypothetical protein
MGINKIGIITTHPTTKMVNPYGLRMKSVVELFSLSFQMKARLNLPVFTNDFSG